MPIPSLDDAIANLNDVMQNGPPTSALQVLIAKAVLQLAAQVQANQAALQAAQLAQTS